MKKLISILVITGLMLTVFASCTKQNKIEYTADEKVLSFFSDTTKPEDILKDVENVDFYHEMNTDGLSEETVTDEENDTAVVTFKDSDGNIIYERYDGYGEKGFSYYTTSQSGEKITVSYYYGFYESDNERDVRIAASGYSVSFDHTNKEKPYGAESVKITVYGKSSDLLQDSISYCLEDNVWCVSADYLADDGVHSYYTYVNDNGEIEEYDSFMFEKKNDITPMDLSEMIDFTKDSGSKFEMKLSSAPFFSVNDGVTKWYFGGDIQFIFETSEKANEFADKFGGESECMGDDVSGYYFIVPVKNSGIAISPEYTGFDPYDYIDINDYSSVILKLDDKNEITGMSYGTISYY